MLIFINRPTTELIANMHATYINNNNVMLKLSPTCMSHIIVKNKHNNSNL